MLFARVNPFGLIRHLDRLTSDCRSVYDVGCGPKPLTRFLWDEDVEKNTGRRVYGCDPYCPPLLNGLCYTETRNIATQPLDANSYDAIILLDVIEHFDKPTGERVLDNLELAARKRVIVMTPNGYLPQPADTGRPGMLHKSGWKIADFERRGYSCYGLNGLKCLRGMYARPRIPGPLGTVLCNLSQLIAFALPEDAFHLLAVRETQWRLK
jgi:hypothetical protein